MSTRAPATSQSRALSPAHRAHRGSTRRLGKFQVWTLGAVVLATGCPDPSAVADATSSTEATSGTTTAIDETTSTAAEPERTDSSTSTTDDSVGVSFILDVDNGPSPFECSVAAQDCPRGEKCSAWNNDGGSAWNATRCFPLDPDPDAPGEPCTVQGSGVSGMDSCDVGSMCWFVDPTLDGICVSNCIGGPADYTCADPNADCVIGAEGVLMLCVPQCDPLDPDACGASRRCILFEERFVCAFMDASNALGPLETCDSSSPCAPGLHCGDAEAVGQCDIDAPACCTPYCDVTTPDCPAGTQCIPFYAPGEGAPIHANLGVCGQEPA